MPTHHSEYLKIQKVFIKPSRHAFISQRHVDHQWKELNYLDRPDFETSIKEYETFEKCLRDFNIDITHFPKDDSVPIPIAIGTIGIDSIYCRDASIATDFGMLLCNMGKAARKKEPTSHKQFYIHHNIPVLGEIKSPGTLEGGDVAWLDEKTLAVGHTYRTNAEGIEQLKQLLEPKGIQIIVAELPHYKGQQDVFHLMSILSPVDKDLAVVYSPLMPIKFRNELLGRGFKLVEVPDEEFESMGCNVLALAPKKCLMVAGNPITQKRLENAGCKVKIYKGVEISIKGGGGPTCLTRPMLRSH